MSRVKTMLSLHPDLYRNMALVVVACSAVGCMGLFMLIGAVMAFPAAREIPDWVMYLFGSTFLAMGVLGPPLTFRWHRQASKAVRSRQGIPGSLLLRVESDIESTTLVGTVEAEGLGHDVPVEDLNLRFPRWEVAPLLNGPVPVSVFVHPTKDRVVAFETSHGILWTIPH